MLDNLNTSLDCLSIIHQYDSFSQTFQYFGVFHKVNYAPPDFYSGLFLVSKKSPISQCGGWQLESNLSLRGSQGYLFQQNDKIYLAYEYEDYSGNTVAIRQYQGFQQLKQNLYDWEYQLNHLIFMNEYDINRTKVCNLGTPNIEEVDLEFGLIKFKFHFYPFDGPWDLPGYGIIKIFKNNNNKSQIYQNYSDWQGYMDWDVYNAIRGSGGLGKIGQRDKFIYKDKGYYLYEAQLNDNPDDDDGQWKSWRLFIYDQDDKTAQLLPIIQNDDYNFANPHTKVIGDQFVLTAFVFSDVNHNNSQNTGDFMRVFTYQQSNLQIIY